MRRKRMCGGAVDPVQLSVKIRLHTAIHLVVSWIGKALKAEAHRRKYTEVSFPFRHVHNFKSPHLMESVLRHKNTPGSPDPFLFRADQ